MLDRLVTEWAGPVLLLEAGGSGMRALRRGGEDVNPTGSVVDVDVLGLSSSNHEADRKDGLSALLPWVIGGAWTLVILAWANGWAGAMGHDHLIEHGPAPWLALGLFLAGWQVMVVAMMLPSSLSAFRSFGALTLGLHDRRSLGAAFLAGYVVVWTGFGLLAFLGDVGFHRFVHRWPWLATRPWLIVGSVLVVAGVFELSPLARLCGRRNGEVIDRRGGQHGFIRSDAMSLGVDHGLQRLSRCWPLMLLSFAVGMASLGWMVVLTLLMVVQERSGGEWASLLMGIALVALAGIVVAHPGWMPSLFPGAA
jgi:predicted metal-binding membrane protein